MSRSRDAMDTEAQAAVWVVRLDTDSSTTQVAQWQRWASESARHHAVYIRLANIWQRTECLRRLCPLDGEVRLDLLDSFP